MKKRSRRGGSLVAVSLMSLALTACKAGASQTVRPAQTETAAQESTLEELAFAPGGKIESDTFTGNAYIKPMVMNDEVYNFPQNGNRGNV